MKNFEFKSQICTTKEQSERLLKLGLKKETADMSWFRRSTNADFECCTSSYTEWLEEILPIVDDYTLKDIIPAWSLHRLIEISDVDCFGFLRYTSWDDIVRWLCGLIEKGAINSEYLDKKYNS